MRLTVLAAALTGLTVATPAAAAPPDNVEQQPGLDLFDIRTSEWVSLHFFAFHAARAMEGGDYGYTAVPLRPEDAALLENPTIAAEFAPLAEAYAPLLKGRLFRGGLFSVVKALTDPDAIDPEIRAPFDAFMPTYRRYFWARHRAFAELAKADLEAKLAAHGPALLAATAAELDATWGDSGYVAYLSPYVNWAGAFSNDNMLFFSATDENYSRHRLEMFVHETAHGSPIGDTIDPAAEAALAAAGLENDRFWHYLLFYATGRAAKRVLGDDYATYIETTGLRTHRGSKPWYDALEAVWDEHDTLEERAIAAAAMVAAQQDQ
ncbi:hypothetical protein [Sphingomicrobium clamense]|uniref:DUF4932 domain-containing protein n=1 Tax=Sphingomicrobium clamense TaxID=2851013 RepID=A0ABS6V2D0_9SPHN|nr:hypothetical protein [Sphingomicrobium sp. B8]MBW0143725.1 hypothetical protein [Sphingomicrobium sp. B8]